MAALRKTHPNTCVRPSRDRDGLSRVVNSSKFPNGIWAKGVSDGRMATGVSDTSDLI